ncbi:MAG: flagellin [Bdellovibrionota bacterium]
MGMRIRTNTQSMIAQRHLSNSNEKMGESLEKLASGYRINKSKDDAAGLAISENLRGTVRGLNVAKRNANDAISMVQVAEGSMNEMGNILIRMRELTVQSASDTIGDKERSFLNREYVQLADEIQRIANTTEFNGNRFFQTGDDDDENIKTKFVVQVGVNATSHEANRDTLTIDLSNLKINVIDMGLIDEARNAIGAVTTDSDEFPTQEEIASKLGVIDKALFSLSSERASLGAVQSRLGSTINNLSISTENMQTARSRIKDVDFAEETSVLTQQRILSQSGVSVLSQANVTGEMALQLLR